MLNVPKILILSGLALIAMGIVIWLLMKLPGIDKFGKLPGDIHIQKENFSFHFPIVTCLLVSLILSFLFYLFSGFKK